jgi:hypothetical protein
LAISVVFVNDRPDTLQLNQEYSLAQEVSDACRDDSAYRHGCVGASGSISFGDGAGTISGDFDGSATLVV